MCWLLLASVHDIQPGKEKKRKEKKKRNSYSKDDIIYSSHNFLAHVCKFLSYSVHRTSIKSCVDIISKASHLTFFYFILFFASSWTPCDSLTLRVCAPPSAGSL